VAEQLLDRSQVGAALEQVGREGMPQTVRMWGDAAQRAGVEPPPTSGEEERILGAVREGRPDLEPKPEPVRRLLAERDEALLAALAEHPDALAVEVDVREVEVDRLAAAESGGVDELDERAVPDLEEAPGAKRLELGLDLFRLGGDRKASRPSRSQPGIGNARRPERETKEGADGGELPRDRRGSEPAGNSARPSRAQVGHVVSQHPDVDGVDRRPPGLEPGGELDEVEPVAAACRVRQCRAGEIPVDCGGALHQPPFAAVKAASCLAACALATGLSAASGATQAIRVPPGFRVEVFASGLERPTAMAFSPGGVLHATQEGGEVVRVRRGSRRPQVVLRGFRTPLGLTWLGKHLVVSAQGTLWRISRGERAPIVKNLPFGRHQQDNVITRHGRLYLGSGSTCDVCAERSPRSAAVLSVRRPDGRDLQVVARGLRNPYGLAVHPGTGRLYASVNERDRLGDNEPAETIVEIRQGRHFGWPRCWPSHRRKRLVGDCRGVTPPVAYLEPHSAPGGMAFWNGALYVAEWGEYLKRRHGRKVSRVVLRAGRSAAVSTFATGFEHPLAVAVDRAGGLLVADHGRGVIYRIRRR
jgi:glucose/arabinose dehydrogenase